MPTPAPRATSPAQHGFTLLELLAVVVILGVLAAVAIPSFLHQRRSAWETAAHSDLRNAAVEIETVANDHGYPDALVPVGDRDRVLELRLADAVLATTNLSPGVELTLDCADDPDRVCVCADHANLGYTVAVYDSASGQLHDPDELAVDCVTRPTGAPVLVAGPLTSFFDCDENGCSYGVHSANDAGRLLFPDAPLTTDGSLLLRDAALVSGSGWAITYGAHDDQGRMTTGYTLQLDPGARGFVIRAFGADGRHDWQFSPLQVEDRSFDFSRPQDIEARVEDGHLSLIVGGERILHYEMGSGAAQAADANRRYVDLDQLTAGGSFGVRSWENRRQDNGDPQVTFRDPRLELRD